MACLKKGLRHEMYYDVCMKVFSVLLLLTHTYGIEYSICTATCTATPSPIMAEGIELKPLGASAPPLPPRHPDTAPGSLGKAYRSAEEKAKAMIHLQQDAGLDAISVWALVLSSWSVSATISHYISL